MTDEQPRERLLDDSITATTFDSDAVEGALPSRAKIVVIGGGIVGASTAMHLAEAGETDVLLLERAKIAAGTSWHAAGLLARVRGSHAMTELANYGVDRYAGLEAQTGVPIGFNQNGSLTLARQPGRVEEMKAAAAIGRHHGIASELLSADQVVEQWPLASTEGVLGGLLMPGDGTLNPGWAALAFAKAAHDGGVTIREGVRVEALLTEGQGGGRRVTGVRTEEGHVIEADQVALCGGLWTRDLAALAGVSVPLYAAEHVHVTSAPVEGAAPSLPILRDLDGYLYVRHHRGCLVVGAFEPDGKPRPMDSLASDFAFGEFEFDWDHFAPVRANAERAVPALRETTWERPLCAPESFTPDANFCLGEAPELKGLFIGAGFNSQGIIYAPGAGKMLAEWVIERAPTFDASAVDVARFARVQSNRHYLHERTREGLGRLYAMHWPHLQPSTARGVRRTPLYERLREANAVFGEAVAWERANWYAPPGTEPAYEYSYGRQNWFEPVSQEHRAAREHVALFDLSSFAKFEVTGPAALAVLQGVCTADVDVAVGRAVYTLMLNRLGGIELDGTVTRLGTDRFLVVTPTVMQHKTFWRLQRAAASAARKDQGTAVITDLTSAFAVLHLAGPKSRDLLARISPGRLDDDAFPRFTSRELEIGDSVALTLRVSFTGELGYELYVPADQAIGVWDALREAGGSDLAPKLAGYHALDSLRTEVGYRHLGHDIGPSEDPFQAQLGRFVAMGKPGAFHGHAALAARYPGGTQGGAQGGTPAPDRAQAFVLLDEAEPILLGGESILRGGAIVGQLTSGSYGWTLGAAAGLAFVDDDTFAACRQQPLPIELDVLGQIVSAKLSAKPFRTPRG